MAMLQQCCIMCEVLACLMFNTISPKCFNAFHTTSKSESMLLPTSVLPILGVGQNLLGELQPVLVLFLLVASLREKESESQ